MHAKMFQSTKVNLIPYLKCQVLGNYNILFFFNIILYMNSIIHEQMIHHAILDLFFNYS